MTRYRGGFFPRIRAIIPATRYTCVVLPRILVSFPALWGFYSQVYDHFLTNGHIYAHKKAHIYALQTSMCIWGHRKSWYKRHRIIPSAKNPLERLCTLFHKCWPKKRSIQLEITVRQAKHDSWARDNVKHDLESLLEQIGFSSFLSLTRIITFSPPRTRSKPPSLEAFYFLPPFTL